MIIGFNQIIDHIGQDKIKGIVHIGAHKAEEFELYNYYGIKKVLWIEANPDLIKTITDRISSNAGHKVIQSLLGNRENELVRFNLSNETMASSVLELKEHSTLYPDIKYVDSRELTSRTFDQLIEENQVDLSEYNFLNIDVQGNELKVFQGMLNSLSFFEYFYCEVSLIELYSQNPLLGEIDAFLIEHGFSREITNLKYESWGDALFIRKPDLDKIVTRKNHLAEVKRFQRQFERTKSKKRKQERNEKLKQRIIDSLNYRLGLKIPKPKKIKSGNNDPVSIAEKKFFKNWISQIGSKIKNPVIFDVGANIGAYSVDILASAEKKNTNLTLFIFEPQKDCLPFLNELHNRFSNHSIQVVPKLVGDENKLLDFYSESKGDSQGSIYRREIYINPNTTQIDCIRLDDFLAEEKIEQVHLLKLDVEGHEFNVLKGLGNRLKDVHIIQFEYGGTYKDAGVNLEMVFKLLSNEFYLLSLNDEHLFPLIFSQELETFHYTNFLALNKKHYDWNNLKW